MIKKYYDFINESVYYDVNDNIINVGDLVEVKYTTGGYGQTKTIQGTITRIDQYRGITLDDELYIAGAFEYDFKTRRNIGYTKNSDYEHGHTTYVKKITPDNLNPKYEIPKQIYTYTIRLIDYSNGKNRDKRYGKDHPIIFEIKDTQKKAREKFEKWMKENYPNVDLVKNRLDYFSNSEYVKKYNSKVEPDGFLSRPTIEVTVTGKNTYIDEYGIVDIE